jgi:hypothetical protein
LAQMTTGPNLIDRTERNPSTSIIYGVRNPNPKFNELMSFRPAKTAW